MTNYKFFIVSFLTFVQSVFSQVAYKTPIESREVIEVFSKQNVQWSIPVSEKETLPLQWTERITSFTEKEGIHSFVGYQGDAFVATLSFSKSKSVSGSFNWKDAEWRIRNSEDGYLIIEREPDSECGVCNDGNCANPNITTHNPYHTNTKRTGKEDTGLKETLFNHEIFSDGILRIYRLALLVDYSYFTDYPFYSDKDAVKTFWAQVESFMNELYQRDIGIKFKIVDDDRLIRDTSEKKVYTTLETGVISSYSTFNINKIIEENLYDIGVSIAKFNKYKGLAELYSAYSASNKGNATSIPNPRTIAHEIGHLFGSDHTFSEGGIITMQTEPGRGRSVMSYGNPRDFFSLPSIYYIRKAFLNQADYYDDINRTHLVNKVRAENPVYGIDTHNRAPLIDRTRLKKEYTIPKSTFFQFDIKASDPDGDPLLYAVHQADIRRHDQSIAQFIPEKSSRNNLIAYHKKYNKSGNFAIILGTTYDGIGDFTFWIGVNDTKDSPTERENHATRYDMYETKLKIIEGTPFKLTNFKDREYIGGEKVHLTWNVDKKIFANTKVRILLSDDFGETFKHVLVPSTDNDGSCDIVMPNIKVGKTDRYEDIYVTGDALLKIEVIDHVAFDLSDNDITKGGFTIKPSEITFQNLPEEYIEVNGDNLPNAADVTATSTCTGKVTVELETKSNDNIITRTWTATDSCGNKTFAVQNIKIKNQPEKVEPLHFKEPLPQSVKVNCVSDLERTKPELIVEGGKSPKIEYNENIRNIGFQNYYIKRTWVATDEVAEPITYTQEIYLNDIEPPVFSAYPSDMVVKSENDIPEQAELTATDCGKMVRVYKDRSEFVDEQGRKVIEYKWTAQDESFNNAVHTQTIIIDSKNQSPASLKFVKTLSDITVSCAQEVPSAENLLTVGGCDSVEITHEDVREEGSCVNNYTLKRTYTATSCGESVSYTQTIRVRDADKPSFVGTLPQNQTLKKGDAIPVQQKLTATDNCSRNVSVEETQTKKTEGDNQVIIYHWTATDDCGNSIEHEQKLTILQHEPLRFIKTPSDITVSCAQEVPSAEKLLPTTGGCGSSVEIKYEDVKEEGSCVNNYTLKRTYIATSCGESVSYTQTIQVRDTDKPSFVGTLPQNQTLKKGDVIPTQQKLTATDNCSGNIPVKETRTEETEGDNQVIIYHWTATDACGNSIEHMQRITFEKLGENEFVVYNFISTDSNTNNSFEIKGLSNHNDIHLKVFSVSGEKVFEAEGEKAINGFNGYGNVKNKDKLPLGTYFYVIEYRTKDKEVSRKIGYLFIL